MGIIDAFKPEDRTEITYSDFYSLIKQAAQYEIVMNAVNCNMPHRYIREAMTGEKEEEVAEMAQTAEGKAVETKPIHGTRKRAIEKAKKKGTKNHGKNEPEI